MLKGRLPTITFICLELSWAIIFCVENIGRKNEGKWGRGRRKNRREKI